jgi:crotonobetainyl-CoA:carnitine CoA-transferase CaiB-like acyl-CoA transferase
MMPLPLSDVRVVDFSTVLSGPFSAMLLADQGADVVKMEAPGGDSARGLTPVPDTDDLSIGFLAFNRNKRSIILDISTHAGKEAAYRLFQWADVLIINMRVGTRERRGFTYEEITAINPRLIYVSLTGYGDHGPDANLPGVDIVIQARSGDIDGRIEGDGPPPAHTRLYHFDMAASFQVAFAVMLALRERERTGRGQKIEVSLLQAGVALHAKQMVRITGLDLPVPIRPEGMRQTYRCSDGRYILNMRINAGARWSEVFRTLQLEDEFVKDPRFDSVEHRAQNLDALVEALSNHFLTKSSTEWEAIFKAANHQCSIVKEVYEMFDDPQVVATIW